MWEGGLSHDGLGSRSDGVDIRVGKGECEKALGFAAVVTSMHELLFCMPDLLGKPDVEAEVKIFPAK